MSLLHRKTLLAALAVIGITVAPLSTFAQEEGEEEPTDVGDEEKDPDEAPKPDPEPAPDTGGWGEGGDEPEGKYRPRGKTGKLKELEEEEEEEEGDDDDDGGTPDLPPPGFAYLDTVLGFGDVTIVEQTDGATDVTPTASFLIGVGYRIGEVWQVYARFPISTNESDGPREPFVEGARNPDTFKQIAVGSFELGVKPHFIINRDLRIPVGLAFAFPSGQGDMFADPDNQADLGKRIVNVAAAASRGWEDRALFASKRFSITPSGGVLFQVPDLGPGKLRVGGETKVEIMIKTGGADPAALQRPPGEDPASSEIRKVSVNWVLGGHVWYDFFDGLLSPGLRLWLAVGTADEVRGSIDPGAAQFIFEPSVATHVSFLPDEAFGMDARVGVILPAGSELGGDGFDDDASGIIGLRIMAGFFF